MQQNNFLIDDENTIVETVCVKWEKRLDDYENYVIEYIKHYKKAVQGDSSSLSKYPYLKVKGEGLGLKLEKAKKKGLLTEKQLEKIIEIQLKIFNTICDF